MLKVKDIVNFLNEKTLVDAILEDNSQDENITREGFGARHAISFGQNIIKIYKKRGLNDPSNRCHLDLLEENLKLCIFDEIKEDISLLKGITHEFGHFMHYYWLPDYKIDETHREHLKELDTIRYISLLDCCNQYEHTKRYLTKLNCEVVAENFAYKNIMNFYQKLVKEAQKC